MCFSCANIINSIVSNFNNNLISHPIVTFRCSRFYLLISLIVYNTKVNAINIGKQQHNLILTFIRYQFDI